MNEIKKKILKYQMKITWQHLLTFGTFIFFLYMMRRNLMHSALWGDEWVEFNYSRVALPELYNKIVSTFQPPLYNYLMHFWLLIRSDVLWFRLFNILLGLISAVYLYKTVRIYYNIITANVVLLMLAVCYQWIYCVQECSEYCLMLMFLFATFYYFICVYHKFSIKMILCFIFSCILAMYSQYGAFFVISPLIVLLFIHVLCSKNRKNVFVLGTAYIGALLFFALPLYFFFARVQTARNQITSHIIKMTWADIENFPTTLGGLIRYFWNFGDATNVIILFKIAALAILAICIILLKVKIENSKKALVLSFLFSIAVYYILTVKHLYAMVHPNQSAGFYGRYSYFLIPMFAIIIPVLIMETIKSVENISVHELIRRISDIRIHSLLNKIGILLCAIVLFVSFPKIMGNWNKARDDQFAEIWVENKGYEETTYLIGTAQWGFDYYVSKLIGYDSTQLDNVVQYTPDISDSFPDEFWLWRTNWGGDGFAIAVNAAKAQGYEVKTFVDSGYSGQLARCYKP